MKPTHINWYWVGEKLFYLVWIGGNALIVIGTILIPIWMCGIAFLVCWNSLMLRLEFERKGGGG